ncbi:MAG: cytochrome c3 family protein, partial [Halopseudomonas sp.]
GSGLGSGISNVAALPTNKDLGTDLSNDHPISVTYDSGLDTRDGEMRGLDANQQQGSNIGRQGDGDFVLELQNTGTIDPDEPGQVQCTTCHDPHISGYDEFTATSTPNTDNSTPPVSIKFLRGNRFQNRPPVVGNTSVQKNHNIICIFCHTKGFDSWKLSAHADPTVGDEQYKEAAANEREFPTDGTNSIQVWEAACLNCHDTHSASGQKKLLRKNASDSAGNQENTCYQCHNTTGNSILDAEAGSTVPNIKTEFAKTRRMPITTTDQAASSELHNIGGTNNGDGANFIENANNLGINSNSRHAECTDCHNPHRVIRNKRFNANYDAVAAVEDDTMRTHETGMDETSTGDNDGREGNVASGVLRGAWGVDLASPSSFRSGLGTDWPELMTVSDFEVKSGDPGTDSLTTAEADDHLTREYQLCFKCHSSYALNYGNRQSNLGPSLGGTGTTPSGTNTMTNFTNVAAEFLSVDATNPPTSGTDQGEESSNGSNEGTACGGGDCNPTATGPIQTNNHRSWHPVVFPTGRDRAERKLGASTSTINFKAPWADNIGTQTMQCSDCHGGEDSYTAGVGADLNEVQGPHGSSSNFLLKSTEPWDATNSWLDHPDGYGFCGGCHQPRVSNSSTDASGFDGDGSHRPDSKMGGEACPWCHIAVPHGWKNKQFLANLLCVGPEGGAGSGCTAIGNYNSDNYSIENRAPYYNKTRLRVPNWARSGSWGSSNCGGSNMEDGCPRNRG